MTDAAKGTLSGDLEAHEEPAGGGNGEPVGAADLEVERELGRGGMGVIWIATQRSLERPVAVKTLKADLVTGPAAGKFEAEALVTGRLEHPNIPPVHLYGRDGKGRPFLCMKLVKGVEWAKLLDPQTDEEKARAAGMDRRAHLEILERVCEAIAFAHSHGVIHRDLKPENVMVGEFGEVQVMDWGIALQAPGIGLQASGGRSRPEARGPRPEAPKAAVGTPAYMAPEMASADEAKQGPWTDVYLLGGIVYEILTGTPPHRGENVMQVLLAAQAGEVEPPALRLRSGQAPGRDIPEPLAEIAMKALEADPAKRYQSARELEDAIVEFMRNEASLRVAKAGLAALAGAEAEIALGEKTPAEIYPALAACVAKLKQAEDLWAGNRAAREGLARARLAYAAYAVGEGDLDLAGAQLAQAPQGDARAEELGRRIAEVRAARERASRMRRALFAGLAALLLVVGWFAWGQVEARRRRSRAVGETDGAIWLEPAARVEAYQRAVAIDPDWPEGWSDMGRAYADWAESLYTTDPPACARALEAAIPCLTRALELEPENAIVYAERANTYEWLGESGRALVDHRKIIELDPEAEDAREAGSLIAIAERRFEDAEREATRALAGERPSEEMYRLRAWARLCLGKLDEALADALKAEEMWGRQDDWIDITIALIHAARGDDLEAARRIVRALRFQPRSPYALALLAWHAARQGDLERAEALAAKAREGWETFRRAYLSFEPRWRALAYGRPPVDELGRAIAIELDLAALVPAEAPRPLALRRRGEERLGRGEVEAALADAERAVADDPADGSARLLRARCLIELGHAEEARDDLALVERLAPNRAAEAAKLAERREGQ